MNRVEMIRIVLKQKLRILY